MKRVFIDMDNVLVDFQSGLDQVSEEVKAESVGRLDEIPGLFAKMKPMEGAVEAVHELQKQYDLFILSTAPWKNPSAWSDKVEWVTKYLDDVFHKRLIISHRKDLCQGDYLIDDHCQNGGDAMTIFPRIKDMEPEEAKASRQALLDYCKLDTWAMVKVWEKLKEMAE